MIAQVGVHARFITGVSLAVLLVCLVFSLLYQPMQDKIVGVSHAVASARVNVQLLVNSIIANVVAAILGFVTMIVKTSRKPVTAALTTFLPIAVFWKQWSGIGGFPLALGVAAICGSLRFAYGHVTRRVEQRPVKASAPAPPPRFLIHGNEYFPELSKVSRSDSIPSAVALTHVCR